MRTAKKHLCKSCGDNRPENFYHQQKGECKACVLENRRIYQQENKDSIRERKKIYQQKNKHSIREKKKAYYQNNKDIIIAKEKKRRKEDISFKFGCNLRVRQNKVLKGGMSTTKGLGCSSKQLVEHLVSQFQKGMTLENHGEWHMDHIIPLSTVEVDENGKAVNSEYNRKLIHYTNLQPLWAEDNLKKGNKF